jgi:uncharacterized SAM-binding protein YcdF (DUF218 family)
VIRGLARLAGAPLSIRDPFATLDAIVVLGAPLLPGGRLSEVVAERVRAAAALYLAGGAPIVCATGKGEAGPMIAALAALGVPGAALRLEDRARSTAENAACAAALLAPARAVWLVTQPFHARRARWHFRRAGLDARVWHIADSVQYERPARALRWIAREYGAFAANAISGRGSRPL